MVYDTDPLVTENEYVDVVIAPDFIPLDRFTYHAVPDGNPDSVNVTVYLDVTLTAVKVIGTVVLLPLTVAVPDDFEIVYPEIDPMVYS